MIARILRFILGAVFLYAAYTKLSQPLSLFALSIDSYQLLPDYAVFAVAYTLPFVELGLGVLLMIGWSLRWVATATAVILGVFFILMLRSYGKGMGIDCGCFGVGESLSVKTLIRDGVLLAAAIALAVLAFKKNLRNR
jgi:uncharacterized membrane protein YphA (DoxX/SURF4 family)